MSTRNHIAVVIIMCSLHATVIHAEITCDSLWQVPAHTDDDSTHNRVASSFPTNDSISARRTHAHALLQEVLSAQRFLESLDAMSEIELPVGIVKAGGSLDYTVLVDRIVFSKEGALMDVYLSLALPQAGTRLAFHGRVPLSATGGVGGAAKAFLIGDHRVNIDANTTVTIMGNERTFVEFDCDGFLGVNIDAELELPSDLFLPEDNQGNILDERLRISLRTYTQSLNDILVTVSIPPFQIKGLRDFSFSALQASLDWSDVNNPEGMVFPEKYFSPLASSGFPELWRGIYIREFVVQLPRAFARQGSDQRISVGAKDFLIDDMGLTGELYASNLFRDGDMNGWLYTLDRMSLYLAGNRVAGFAFQGDIVIPMIKARDGANAHFGYTAQRDADGNYLFAVDVETSLRMDLWLADLKLSNGSRVIVRQKESRFYPSAILNGELSIHLTEKGPKARFNSIRFEGMVINSEPPYFQPGTFGFGREDDPSTLAKYPVVLTEIAFRGEDRRVGIAFDLLVNITGNPDEDSFAGKTRLTIWGEQDKYPNRNEEGKIIGIDQYSWHFDEVELGSVKVSITKPKIVELTGEVRFFDDDRIYGEGFKGRVKGKIHRISVEAEALFGRTETFRYWYADALIEMKHGLPVMPGVLSAFGFGGGYYSRMKQTNEKIEGTLGRAPSGLTYVPDENAVGVRAIVLIGTPRPEAMRGDVSLEVSLNRHGGMKSVTFTGNALFMSVDMPSTTQIRQLASDAVAGTLTEQLTSLRKGQVFGSVTLHFDNVNDAFHGNLEIYVNVAGGLVRGVNPNNKAGWAVMHFERDNWYIHIGSPAQPIGLEVARLFKAKSYFMLGHNLPGSPPPPPQVSEILGNINLDYMRDLNALQSGTGIAFGLHFLVDTGDLRFLMFYGRFSAGTGLDFMLKDYGTHYHCAGSEPPLGINGWYANGQAYAFVSGKIGIRVNLRFYKGRYEILSIGAATILQAKGPNPFWMRGTVGGTYRILGGLVRGRCRFDVTIGKDCQPVGEEELLRDINMISGITPTDASTDVSVFNAPQVIFNIPVEEVFRINDMENKTHVFRAVLDEFVVRKGSGVLPGNLVWNSERDVVVFDAHDLLPAETPLIAEATLSFQEFVDGDWTPVRFNGALVTEHISTTFTTGKAPEIIPPNNVAFSYPLRDQLNYHPLEYTHGFIQLVDGQPYLFNPPSDWMQKVRFTETTSGHTLETSLTYQPENKTIWFEIPRGLPRERIFRLEIVNIPKNAHQVDENVYAIEKVVLADQSGNTVTASIKGADENLEILETKPIYSSLFRTSRYNTFAEKMKNIRLSNAIRLASGINTFRLISSYQGDELFDLSEINPLNNGTVRIEAILSGNKWYERHVYPLVYEGYPLLGWMTTDRPNAGRTGIPPTKDVFSENARTNLLQAGISSALSFTDEYLTYNLGESVAFDFHSLQRRAVNYLVDNGSAPPRIQALISAPLPHIRKGSYKLRFSYTIPGIDKTTSTYDFEIHNHTPDAD